MTAARVVKYLISRSSKTIEKLTEFVTDISHISPIETMKIYVYVTI